MPKESNHNVVHFATTCDGRYELQFTMSDDLGRMFLVTGECRDCVIDVLQPAQRYTGLDVMGLLSNGCKGVLLGATEIKVVADSLKAVGYSCGSIDYYAIINLINTSLIAEHRLTEERAVNYGTGQNARDCDQRPCNHFRNATAEL